MITNGWFAKDVAHKEGRTWEATEKEIFRRDDRWRGFIVKQPT